MRTHHLSAPAVIVLLAACVHASRGPGVVTGESAVVPAAAPPAATEPKPAAESPAPPQPAASPSVTDPEGGAPSVVSPATTAPNAPVASPSASSQSIPGGAKSHPAKQPTAPATGPKSAAVSSAGAPVAGVATAAAATAAPPTPSKASGPPPLDLKGLEQRLRDTRAIGLFTKLSLKNQVDDLLAQFKAFHQGQPGLTVAQLRQKYELLLMKVVTLLQDGDPALASAVSSSREAIWEVLTDPQKFAAIGYST